MKWHWIKILAIVAFIVLPGIAYYQFRALPKKIVFPQSLPEGRYARLINNLSQAIRERSEIEVNLTQHQAVGSLQNIKDLQERKTDFTLYQSGSNPELEISHAVDVRFVANLYSEVVHILVHTNSEIHSIADFHRQRMRFFVGHPGSGHYAVSRQLLDHMGLGSEDYEEVPLELEELPEAFRLGELEVAFLTAGLHAPFFRSLIQTGKIRILDLPYPEAFAKNFLPFTPYAIPAGLYQTQPRPVPGREIQTVAVRAQLLSHRKTDPRVVFLVTQLIHHEDFLQENQLKELFEQGRSFAQDKAEFPIHRGARDFYDPKFRPLLPSEFVESMEGMRSFVVSLIVALFFGIRWYKLRRIRMKEHKLDRFLRKLLEIERRQVDFDNQASNQDLDRLQKLLDEVTFLRQEALRAFSVHDLNEDRGADCFINMCHALSNKINAKISRQRFDKKLDALIDTVKHEASNRAQ